MAATSSLWLSKVGCIVSHDMWRISRSIQRHRTNTSINFEHGWARVDEAEQAASLRGAKHLVLISSSKIRCAPGYTAAQHSAPELNCTRRVQGRGVLRRYILPYSYFPNAQGSSCHTTPLCCTATSAVLGRGGRRSQSSSTLP